MILDNLLMFDSTLAPRNLAQVAATYTSTNILDLHIINGGLPVLSNLQGARDIGIGDDPAMKLLCQVSTTFTSGGAGTLQVKFQGATDNGAGAPNAFSDYWVSPAYALATLVVGARLFDMDVPRPPAGIAIPRFLQISYVIGAATMTAGAVICGIVLDRDDQPYQSTGNSVMGGYPAGITVAN
jgi:hypothetical protein